MKQKGFTLIELMVVIVILGILAGIAIPKMFGLSDKSKISEAPTVLKTYETLQQAYIAEQSKIGSFKSITFNRPEGSQYFNYGMGDAVTATSSDTDNTPADNAACGVAAAFLKVNIGSCSQGNLWVTAVPNGTDATQRVIKTGGTGAGVCSDLSPATFKTVGSITGC